MKSNYVSYRWPLWLVIIIALLMALLAYAEHGKAEEIGKGVKIETETLSFAEWQRIKAEMYPAEKPIPDSVWVYTDSAWATSNCYDLTTWLNCCYQRDHVDSARAVIEGRMRERHVADSLRIYGRKVSLIGKAIGIDTAHVNLMSLKYPTIIVSGLRRHGSTLWEIKNYYCNDSLIRQDSSIVDE